MYGTVTIAVRGMTRTESANTLVIWQLSVLAFFHSFLLLFGWRWPTPLDAAMLFGTGFTNAIGQWFWTKSLHLAPAPAVTPFYYLMLVWSMGIGYLVWGDVPTASFLSARPSSSRPACSCFCGNQGCSGDAVSRRNPASLDQFRDPVDDRLRCRIGLFDQGLELLAILRIDGQFAQFASAMKSGSFMVASKASRSIFSRSGGSPGGAMNGRPMPWPA